MAKIDKKVWYLIGGGLLSIAGSIVSLMGEKRDDDANDTQSAPQDETTKQEA